MSYQQIILDRGVPLVRSLAVLGMLGSALQPVHAQVAPGRPDTPAEIELGTKLSVCMAKEVVWRNAHLDMMDLAIKSMPSSAARTAYQTNAEKMRAGFRALQQGFLATIQKSVPASRAYNGGINDTTREIGEIKKGLQADPIANLTLFTGIMQKNPALADCETQIKIPVNDRLTLAGPAR